MWNQIINQMIRCCAAAYNWFTSFMSALTQNGSGPWNVIFGIICACLACRFVFYPFLKGRVVGGVGEEIGRHSNNVSSRFVRSGSDRNY